MDQHTWDSHIAINISFLKRLDNGRMYIQTVARRTRLMQATNVKRAIDGQCQ